MGIYQLSDFRTRMNAALGDRGHTDAELDLWINAGYFELVGAVEFERLKSIEDLSIVSGTSEYPVTGILAITGITIESISKRLIKTSVENLQGRARTQSGRPRYWAWAEGNIVLWPTPDSNYDAVYIAINEPDRLTADADQTVLPGTWDTAIHMLGTAQAFLDLGEDQRSLYWHDRAMKYAGSRMTDAEYGAEAVSEPVQPVHGDQQLDTIYP